MRRSGDDDDEDDDDDNDDDAPAVFFFRHATARWFSSTNHATSAPLETASSPSAPEPANRSRTAAPSRSTRLPTALKSASRTRSVVGLVPAGGTVIVSPRRRPEMMRVMSSLWSWVSI